MSVGKTPRATEAASRVLRLAKAQSVLRARDVADGPPSRHEIDRTREAHRELLVTSRNLACGATSVMKDDLVCGTEDSAKQKHIRFRVARDGLEPGVRLRN